MTQTGASEVPAAKTGSDVIGRVQWCLRRACLGLLLLGCFAVPLGAADPPKDEQVVSSKATQRTSAAAVNFRKDLSLPFASLNTLGSRVQTAQAGGRPGGPGPRGQRTRHRREGVRQDRECHVVADAKESAELANMRRQEAELKALLHVSNQVMFAEGDIKSMKDQLDLAQAQTKADQDAFKRNEEPKSTPRQVVVNNYTTQYLDVYVNGFLKGQIQPGESRSSRSSTAGTRRSSRRTATKTSTSGGRVWFGGVHEVYVEHQLRGQENGVSSIFRRLGMGNNPRAGGKNRTDTIFLPLDVSPAQLQ